MTTQLAAWSTETDDHDNFTLVRMYEGGRMTVCVKSAGCYGPEFDLTPEPWFESAPVLTVVS
jgi:hypothetical protein